MFFLRLFFGYYLLCFCIQYATIDMVLYLLRRFIMKAVQFIFCFLALFCVAAAVMVGLLGEYLYAIIPLAAAVVFGVLLLLTARKKKPIHPESSETPQDNSGEN